MPITQITQTVHVIIMTPAQAGSVPFDAAAKHEAPDIELIAFHPVVEIIEKTTTSRLPQ
jgi:hypothetical protein